MNWDLPTWGNLQKEEEINSFWNSIQINNNYSKFEKIDSLKNIELPKQNFAFCYLITKQNNIIDILKNRKINFCFIFFATIDDDAINLINKLENCQILARSGNGEDYFKKEVKKIKHKITTKKNHIKLILFENENGYFVINSSANPSKLSTANYEILTIDNNKDLFNFWVKIYKKCDISI